MKYCVMEGKIDGTDVVVVVSADNNKEIKKLRKEGLKISFRFRTKEELKQGEYFVNIVE